MFWRILFTAAALVVAAAGGMVVECVDDTVDVVTGDPVGVCAMATTLGSSTGLAFGGGLVLFAVLAIMAVWVPSARPHRRGRVLVETTLKDNLGRLNEVGTELTDVDPGSISATHAVRLTRKLETVEHALSSEAVPPREASQQWFGLLRETNDLHNRDLLATEDFKTINTRLLDLFSPSRTDAAESSAELLG